MKGTFAPVVFSTLILDQRADGNTQTRASASSTDVAKPEETDMTELREENEAQQKRLEVLEEENARLWHHVARFESGEEDKPIALDISRVRPSDCSTRLILTYVRVMIDMRDSSRSTTCRKTSMYV